MTKIRHPSVNFCRHVGSAFWNKIFRTPGYNFFPNFWILFEYEVMPEFIVGGSNPARSSVVLVGWWSLTPRVSYGQSSKVARTTKTRCLPIYEHLATRECFVWYPTTYFGSKWRCRTWKSLKTLMEKVWLLLLLYDCMLLIIPVNAGSKIQEGPHTVRRGREQSAATSKTTEKVCRLC